MAQSPDEVEERPVEMSALKAGITLKAGHRVILLGGGAKGGPEVTGDGGGDPTGADPTGAEGGGTASGDPTGDSPLDPTGDDGSGTASGDPTGDSPLDPTGDDGSGTASGEPTGDSQGDPTGDQGDGIAADTLPPGPTPSVFGTFGHAHFDNAKSFPLPDAIPVFRQIATLMTAEPKRVLLVVGHTDSAGSPAYNLTLSQERAAAVKGYLENDVEVFFKFYSHSDGQKKWGVREDQLMLSALPLGEAPFFSGAINGVVNADFKAAVTRFQNAASLPATAVNAQVDAETRKKLIAAYMAADGTSAPVGADIQTLACGERHLEEKTGDGVANAANRRVEIFAFEKGPINPAPSACSGGAHPGCTVLDAWKGAIKSKLDENPPALVPKPGKAQGDIDISLVGAGGEPAQQLAWKITLSDGTKKSGTTGGDGKISLVGVSAGKYKLLIPSWEGSVMLIEPVPEPTPGECIEPSVPEPTPVECIEPSVPEPAPGSGAAAPGPAGGGTPPPEPSNQILKHDDPRLSAHRMKLLAELDSRLPSYDGVAPAAGKKNLFDGVQKQQTGTSCGLLPTVLMQYGMKTGMVGGLAGVFGYGTEGIKQVGRNLGVWVESDGTALPQPGDIYTLRYEAEPDTDSVSHVGVIVDVDPSDGSTWVTGDSGQDHDGIRGATYCNRPMQRVDGTHPYLKGEFTNALRRIGGWVDLDKLMAYLGK